MGKNKEEIIKEIYTPITEKDKMLSALRSGRTKGTTTHIDCIDPAWTWREGEVNIFTGYSNEGKLLPIDTKISTPNGFIEMQNLKIGDIVYDMFGKPCNVVALSDITNIEDAYEIEFSGGLKIIAGAPHQWIVKSQQCRASISRQNRREEILNKRRTGGEKQLKKGHDQRYKCVQPEIKTTIEISKTLKDKNNKLQWSIDLTKPVQYIKKSQSIDPYILGLWLGDGNTSGAQITNIDQEIIDYLKSKYEVDSKIDGKHHICKGLHKQLRELGVLGYKHIPDNYLFSSIEDRLELIKGLMDSDGYIGTNGNCEFTSVLPRLSQDFQILATSLGINTKTNKGKAFLYGIRKKDRYRTNFKTNIQVFKLSRKANRLENASGPKNEVRIIKNVKLIGKGISMMCIEVDSPTHTYLCTEHHIPTHNSLILKQLCLIKALEEGKKFVFYSPEEMSAADMFDDLIHSLSGKSTDRTNPNCISEKEYKYFHNLIEDKFFFIYIKPPNNTLEEIIKATEEILEKNEIFGLIVDPFVKLSRGNKSDIRDDLFAADFLNILIDFSRNKKITSFLVMHQQTPKVSEQGFYQKPNMYAVKNGGTFADTTDNVLSMWRPKYAQDKLDPVCIFSSQKIKTQKLTGIPQDVEVSFDRKTNRYCYKNSLEPLYNWNKWLPDYKKIKTF